MAIFSCVLYICTTRTEHIPIWPTVVARTAFSAQLGPLSTPHLSRGPPSFNELSKAEEEHKKWPTRKGKSSMVGGREANWGFCGSECKKALKWGCQYLTHRGWRCRLTARTPQKSM